MKRNQPQHKYKTRLRGQTTSHMTRMPKDERGHVRQFLDLESKRNLSFANRALHGESSDDKDIRCFKQTNQYAACAGIFQKMLIAGECLAFCKEHVNQVMATLINIMFSGHLVDINGTSIPHPYMFVDNPTTDEPFYTFGAEDINNVDANQTIGDYVIEQFDFTSPKWLEVKFDCDDSVDKLFFDFQGKKWEIDMNMEFQVIVYNQNWRVANKDEQ
jgi:hypothetical protein